MTQRADPGEDNDGGDEWDQHHEDDGEHAAHGLRVRVTSRILKDVARREEDHDSDPDDGVAHEIGELSVSMSLHSPRVPGGPPRAS